MGRSDHLAKFTAAATDQTKTPPKSTATSSRKNVQHPVNPSDPCQVLPSQLWHQVLSLLPLSVVARLSMVSKTWLDGTRAYPAWESICEALHLKLKSRSHMAMVCERSSFICDKCHSFSNGNIHASKIPLPVADEDDHDFVWMLCYTCRLDYYGRHSVGFREDQVEHYGQDEVDHQSQCSKHVSFVR